MKKKRKSIFNNVFLIGSQYLYKLFLLFFIFFNSESYVLAQNKNQSKPVKPVEDKVEQDKSKPVKPVEDKVGQDKSNPVKPAEDKVVQDKSNPVKPVEDKVVQDKSNPVKPVEDKVVEIKDNKKVKIPNFTFELVPQVKSKDEKKEIKKIDSFVKELDIPNVKNFFDFTPTIKLKAGINIQGKAILYTTGEDLVKDYQFHLPYVRLGITGNIFPSVEYTIIGSFDDTKIGLALANLAMFFANHMFSLSIGKIPSYLIREKKALGKLLFANIAPIYSTPVLDEIEEKRNHPGQIIGGSFGMHFVEKRLNIHIFSWNKDFDLTFKNFKRHSVGIRIEYDFFRPWDHGNEWFNDNLINGTIGAGFKYIHNNFKDLKNIPIAHDTSLYIDLLFKINFFYTHLACNISVLGDIFVGFHADFGFKATPWFIPAIRYYFESDHAKYHQTENPKAYGTKHGLATVFNFYPFLKYNPIGHRLKIQIEIMYNIQEPSINFIKNKNKLNITAGIAFDL